jgi:UDP-N-acetylmuramate dehydrogenase
MKLTLEKLKAVMASEYIYENESMTEHTSFKTGGKADLLLIPQSKINFCKALAIAKESQFPVYFMGNGTNLLVRDKGYRGIIINTKGLKKVEINDNFIKAEPGISLKDLADLALENELTGLEFASGIPGSLGGGVTMNAGAYDGEMKNVIQSIEVIKEDGTIEEIPVAECEFGYRKSIIQKNPWVLIGINLKLNKGNYHDIKTKMDDLNQRRQTKQPLEYPSAGSTFRRPEGYYAGKLVQDAGFRGYTVGGAQVSEKHSGFVINKGNATTDDILTLIHAIQKGVKEQFGVDLVTEVIVIGES